MKLSIKEKCNEAFGCKVLVTLLALETSSTTLLGECTVQGYELEVLLKYVAHRRLELRETRK